VQYNNNTLQLNVISHRLETMYAVDIITTSNSLNDINTPIPLIDIDSNDCFFVGKPKSRSNDETMRRPTTFKKRRFRHTSAHSISAVRDSEKCSII